jgi:hypothetical protein
LSAIIFTFRDGFISSDWNVKNDDEIQKKLFKFFLESFLLLDLIDNRTGFFLSWHSLTFFVTLPHHGKRRIFTIFLPSFLKRPMALITSNIPC